MQAPELSLRASDGDGTHTDLRMLLAIPFYKNERLVAPLIQSLTACEDELKTLGVEVLILNDSPDYPALQAAIDRALENVTFPFRVIQNEENKGFVRTMNIAMADAVKMRRDIIILNSDTILFPGAIEEMTRVAALDPMIGFVNPRCNNATLATLPERPMPGLSPEQAFQVAQKLAARLPDATYAPTGVGFCMLIRWKILAEFGLFDEVYGRGYNEENDLVMRAGQCGYRAVLANKAFVWHEGETSFSSSDIPRLSLNARNHDTLVTRYPEYPQLVLRHFDSPPYLAERLLEQLLEDENGKLDIALDFSSFGAFHNGTFKAAEQVLREAAHAWRDKYNLHVICLEDVYKFHNYAQYGVPRADPHGPKRFAVIFRIGQPYDWNSVERMVLKGACLGMYALDTISIDCAQLYNEQTFNIWQFALDHFDLLVTTSDLTAEQFDRRFSINPRAVRARIMHSLDLSDYTARSADPAGALPAGLAPGYVFIVGNHYPHKFVASTARALAGAYPDRTFLALATGPKANVSTQESANIFRVEAGNLTDAEVSALFRNAAAIVFPSHYEGFGLPLLEALAAKKPTFTRRTAVNLQMQKALGDNPNLYLYDTTEELAHSLKALPEWIETAPQISQAHDAVAAAAELRAAIERALANVEYASLVKRLRAAQQAGIGNAFEPHQHMSPSGIIGQKIGRLIAPLLRVPWVFAAARAGYRLARSAYRGLRALIASPSGGQS